MILIIAFLERLKKQVHSDVSRRVISIFFLITLSSCDFDEELFNGYELIIMNASEVRLKVPGKGLNAKVSRVSGCIVGNYNPKTIYVDEIISGNIKSVAKKHPFVTGYMNSDFLDLKLDYACEGYFLINTATDERREGMNVDEWQTELKKVGWEQAVLKQVR